MLYYNYEKSRKGRNRAEKKEKALPIRKILLQKKIGGKRNQSPLLTLYKSCSEYIILIIYSVYSETAASLRKINVTAGRLLLRL